MEEEAAVWGKGAREGAEAEAHFGLSASSYYPLAAISRQGRSRTWRRRQLYGVREREREQKRKHTSDYPHPPTTPPPPPRRRGRTSDPNPICHPRHSG